MAFECESTLVADGDAGKAATAVFCKCWERDCCQPRRRAKLIREIRDGEPNRFITLTTVHRRPEEATKEALDMSTWLRILMRRIQQKTRQKSLAYFVVREAHKDGWPHLHIAWRGPWIDQAWLSEQWAALSGGVKVDIRAIDNPGRVGQYLSKYLGKSPHQFGTSKRYWQSPSYRRTPKFEPTPLADVGGAYVKDARTLSRWLHDLLCRGMRAEEVRPRHFVWRPP